MLLSCPQVAFPFVFVCGHFNVSKVTQEISLTQRSDLFFPFSHRYKYHSDLVECDTFLENILGGFTLYAKHFEQFLNHSSSHELNTIRPRNYSHENWYCVWAVNLKPRSNGFRRPNWFSDYHASVSYPNHATTHTRVDRTLQCGSKKVQKFW